MNYNKLRREGPVPQVDFAVLDRTQDQYNFKEFYRNFAFDNFYRDEDQQEMDEAMKRIREKSRSSVNTVREESQSMSWTVSLGRL